MIELNKCYCMDNLELMKQIDDNSIDLIYSDILYATGKKFRDYQDLKPDRRIIENFYIPRIKEMYRLLKNTGTIYLQMDCRISHWIRCILDDVFGYNFFLNEIAWKTQTSSGMKTLAKKFGHNHDNILIYTKSKKFTFNKQYLKTDNAYIKKIFTHEDNRGKYKTAELQEPSKDTLIKLEENGKIYITKNGKKRYKIYADEFKGILIDDVWTDFMSLSSNSKERLGYDNQKPKILLDRIINTSSNSGDIIADFFCGSGVTGIVSKELDRKFILCDINERAIQISNKLLNN